MTQDTPSYVEIQQEADPSCTPGANLTHLQHVFEGYRAYILEGPQADCPYSPGSARDYSWQMGRQWAKRDLLKLPRS